MVVFQERSGSHEALQLHGITSVQHCGVVAFVMTFSTKRRPHANIQRTEQTTSCQEKEGEQNGEQRKCRCLCRLRHLQL